MEEDIFHSLVQIALDEQLTGWDFSWLNQRTIEEPLPWDYRQEVLRRMAGVGSLLDIGTGGGEFLSSLSPLPPRTCATEGYPPNVPTARARLGPLGVEVVDVSDDDDVLLPFEDQAFDLVINRHSGAVEAEIFRVLKPGGRYFTQQVGGENGMGLNRDLQDEPCFMYAHWTLDEAICKLQAAGLRVVYARQAFPALTFRDIAGVVFFLKVISWQVADFSVEKYRERLQAIHQRIQSEGGYTVREHRFLIEAVKP